MTVSTINIEKPVSKKELLDFLGISETTLARLQKQEKIPFFKAGRRILYQPSEVLKAIKAQSVKV